MPRGVETLNKSNVHIDDYGSIWETTLDGEYTIYRGDIASSTFLFPDFKQNVPSDLFFTRHISRAEFLQQAPGVECPLIALEPVLPSPKPHDLTTELAEGNLSVTNWNSWQGWVIEIFNHLPDVADKSMVTAESQARQSRRNTLFSPKSFAITHLMSSINPPEQLPNNQYGFMGADLAGVFVLEGYAIPDREKMKQNSPLDNANGQVRLNALAVEAASLWRILHSPDIDSHPALQSQAVMKLWNIEGMVIEIINKQAAFDKTKIRQRLDRIQIQNESFRRASLGKIGRAKEDFVSLFNRIKHPSHAPFVAGGTTLGIAASGALLLPFETPPYVIDVGDTYKIPPMGPSTDPEATPPNPLIERLLRTTNETIRTQYPYFSLPMIALNENGDTAVDLTLNNETVDINIQNAIDVLSANGAFRSEEDRIRSDGFALLGAHPEWNVHDVIAVGSWGTNPDTGAESAAFLLGHISLETGVMDTLFLPDGNGGYYEIQIDREIQELGINFTIMAVKEGDAIRFIPVIIRGGNILGAVSSEIQSGGDFTIVTFGEDVEDIEDGSFVVPLGYDVTVQISTLNIRRDPSTNNPEIAKAHQGDELVGVGVTEDGQWLQIYWNGEFAYVSLGFVDSDQMADIPQSTSTPSSGITLVSTDSQDTWTRLYSQLPILYPGESVDPGGGEPEAAAMSPAAFAESYVQQDGDQIQLIRVATTGNEETDWVWQVTRDGVVYNNLPITKVTTMYEDQTLGFFQSNTVQGQENHIGEVMYVGSYIRHYDAILGYEGLEPADWVIITVAISSQDGRSTIVVDTAMYRPGLYGFSNNGGGRAIQERPSTILQFFQDEYKPGYLAVMHVGEFDPANISPGAELYQWYLTGDESVLENLRDPETGRFLVLSPYYIVNTY